MYRRAFFFVTLVVLGAVLPYLLSDDRSVEMFGEWWKSLGDKAAGTTGSSGSGGADRTTTSIYTSAGRSPGAPSPFDVTTGVTNDGMAATVAGLHGRTLQLPQLAGPPGVSLEQLLSFEITQDWITSQWSRITTRLAELDLQGWRVPLARGSDPTDLAGSITYYFDKQRVVQRIVLHGYMANPAELVQLATTRYRMQPVPNNLAELYTSSLDGKTVGAFRIRYAPVIRADVASRRCQILLELNRTGTPYGLSQEFRELLSVAEEAGAES